MANPAMFTWLDRARVALDLSRFALTEPIDAVAGAGVYSTIETHTAGMPTRIVTHGVGVLPGATMLERMQYLQHSDDDVRRLLMYEPRGHSAMCGAIIQPPLQPDTDVGLLFICAGGHLPMCGHAAIGVSTALVASGAIARTESPRVCRRPST
nr:proline racemase family protein [Pseudohalocynthiibacter aestuariivivens]